MSFLFELRNIYPLEYYVKYGF